ncbi:MAG TPA: ATP-binding protein [Anaeromyxobacteraceae bacterium]|nr:ATP-binding protein [Anaeromyxobacteraceae bacterium]
MDEHLSVLLVEDNPGDAELVREAFQQTLESVTLVHVERIADAVERARAGDLDVVLLDLSLPDSVGLAGTRRLRAEFPHLPIVVLTSLEDDRMAGRAVAAGAQDYLIKGQIGPSALLRSMRYAIERQRSSERARLLAEERSARVAAEEMQRRALLLSETSEVLAGAFADDAALDKVARAVVRDFADWFTLAVGESASTLRLAASTHVDASKAEALRRWFEVARDPGRPGAARIVATRSPELHVDVDGCALAEWAGDAEQLELLRHVGVACAMAVPLVAHGRVLGAMVWGRCGARRYALDDLAFAEDVARRIATALESSRLHQEAQRATEALRESERRFRAVLDQVSDYAIFVLDTEGRVASWSAGARLLKGWSQEEILGRSFDAFFPPEDVARGAPSAELARARRDGHFEDEGWRVRKDGSRFLANVVVTALYDEGGRLLGFVKVARDVTEKRRSARNRDFIDRATRELGSDLDPVAALGRLVHLAVPRMADVCGVDLAREDGSAGEFVTAAAVDEPTRCAFVESRLRFPVPPGRSSEVVEALRSGRPVFFPEVGERELDAIGRAPEHREAVRAVGVQSFMAVPLRSRGQAYGSIVFAMTTPGRHFDAVDLQVATELARRAELAIDNGRLFSEMQRAVRARDHVLAVVSHDLNSPLTAIQLSSDAVAQVVATGGATASVQRHLDGIQRGTRRARRLVQDLLDMASIRAGQLAVHAAREDARSLLDEAVEAHEPAARQKDVSLSARGQHGSIVQCDRGRVLQVLSNLIGNALKFCGPGARIDVSLEPAEAFATFTVRDTGPGISPEALAQVFDAYWSTARSRSDGTGLGLFISKGIVEAHGGRIWIESRLGEGTVVRFTIPAARP